jgi:hypothetical protein
MTMAWSRIVRVLRAARPYVVIAAVHVVVALVYITSSASGFTPGWNGLPLDDGWTHMVYARSFGEHFQYFFNPGERESGTTSPLWASLVGIVWRVTGTFDSQLAAVAKVLGMALAVGCGAVVFGIVRYLSGNPRLGLIAALVVVTQPAFVFASVSGMEVALFSFTGLAGCWAFLRSRYAVAGICLGLMTVARPEGLLIVVVTAVALVGRRLWQRSDLQLINREDARQLAFLLAPVLVLAGAWAVWNISVNGGPFPNTYYAKHREMGLLPLGNLWNVARGYFHHLSLFGGAAFPIAVPVVTLGFWSLLRRHGFGAVPLAAFPLALTYAVSLNLPFVSTEWNFFTRRYLDAAIPFIVVGLVLGMAEAWRLLHVVRALRLPSNPQEAHLFNFGLNVAFVVIVVVPFIGLPGGLRDSTTEYSWNTRNIDEIDVAAALWIRENTAPDARIAVGDPGAIRFFSDRYTIDLVGLNYYPAIGRPPLELMEEVKPDYLFAFRSAYFESWPRGREVFEVEARRNTILGGSVMKGWSADYTSSVEPSDPGVPYQVSPEGLGAVVIDRIDVGNANAEASQSEAAHKYRLEGQGGNVSRTFKIDAAGTTVKDDARTFSVAEEFWVKSVPDARLVIAKRYDAQLVVTYRVFVNQVLVGTWTPADNPSFFFGEDTFVIAPEFIESNQTRLRFEVVEGPAGRAGNTFYYWIMTDESPAALSR